MNDRPSSRPSPKSDFDLGEGEYSVFIKTYISSSPPFQSAEMGESLKFKFSKIQNIPLPPNPFFDLGEGRDGGQSFASILSASSYATL